MTPKAIIFDMDGLLVDSENVWLGVETEMLADRGKSYDPEVRAQAVGIRVHDFLRLLINHYGFDETVEEMDRELTARILPRLKTDAVAHPGAQEVIDYVIAQDIPYAIASSSPMSIIDITLEARGWGDIFPVRCSADDETNGKPAPDVYLAAAKRLNIAPEQCLALEDSIAGARAAVAAGMTCYAVPDTDHTDLKTLETVTPHIFASLHDVLKTLRK